LELDLATKEEMEQRKALRRETTKQERAKPEVNLPILKPDLRDLFNHLDQRLAEGS
jgi:hypothetical protein